jgi:hypothetical protein
MSYGCRVPLEDYPYRVEELSPAGELVRILVYADHTRIRLRNRGLLMAEHPARRRRLSEP